MNKSLILLSSILMQACVSVSSTDQILSEMYNIPSSNISEFDGTKSIRMSNMYCSTVGLELYQDTSKSKSEVVLLKAGSTIISNVGDGDSLQINLDGEIYSFASSDTVTNHETNHYKYGVSNNFSNKLYMVSESFIRKAASSKKFLVRLHLLNNQYMEGKCSPVSLREAKRDNEAAGVEIKQEYVDLGNKYTALNGFKAFVKMMDSTEF